MTRIQIAHELGIARTTVSIVTRRLLDQDAIVILGNDSSDRAGSGRPAEYLALDPQSAQFIGFDFGHRRVRMVMADPAHEILAREVVHYPEDSSWSTRLTLASEMVTAVTAERSISLDAMYAIAVGVPGPVMFQAGNVTHPWSASDLVAEVAGFFRELFDCHVSVDNNIRLAGLAESLDAEVSDVIYLSLSDGVGGAVVTNGRLIMGAAGLGGEAGHIRAMATGDQCRCGRYGCLETVASVPAIIDECTRRGVPCSDLSSLETLIHEGNETVNEILTEVGAAIGRTLAGPATLVNCSTMIIGGRIAASSSRLIEAVRESLNEGILTVNGSGIEVSSSHLGDEAGALGALATLFSDSSLMADYHAQRKSFPQFPRIARGQRATDPRTKELRMHIS